MFLEINGAQVEETGALHAKFLDHNEGLIEVRRIVRQLLDLGAVPRDSPLLFLGYFAVLEAMLTHPPKQTDPYDSITRQVKKKIALLNHRCVPAIDYRSFGGTPAETVWIKMYSYRSMLAHGGNPAFDGELHVLGNAENAFNLLEQSVKAVIGQALKEPQLLADLRDC